MAKISKLALATVLACAASTQAVAQSASEYTPEFGPVAGDSEFFIAGSGGSSNDFDSHTFGATASYGEYLTNNVLLSGRQSLGFGLVDDGDDSWNGSTVAAVDYVFDLGRFRPFIGVFAGAVYGKGVDFDGVAGAEGGVKWYANKTTFVQLAASYGPTFSEGFSDGNLQYTLGMGLNF